MSSIASQKIVLASNNTGKIQEIQTIFQNYQIVPQSSFAISEIAETGTTFVENALLKARHAARQSGCAAIADDSGLMVDALDGQPGIYSARYAHPQASDNENIHRLLKALTDVTIEHRQAQFVCVLVFLREAQDPLPLIAQGIWRGRILQQPIGEFGFGYDPIFAAEGYEVSVAQLPFTLKNQLSHRAQALKQLQQLFVEQ
ncbi:MAG: non-canonical purine pyrophosphatase, RdgB/HAM1 family [Pseudomonadota bacterium]|jgi:XTP/dITP diphosphohydrolase